MEPKEYMYKSHMLPNGIHFNTIQINSTVGNFVINILLTFNNILFTIDFNNHFGNVLGTLLLIQTKNIYLFE